jgi:hypothetical protein
MTTLHCSSPSRATNLLSNPATFIIVAMMTGMTFTASGAAPRPLYHLYEERFGLTPAMVTVIFAAYVLSLLLALLTTGALSDHVGFPARSAPSCRSPRLTNVRACCRPSISKVISRLAYPPCSQDFWPLPSVCLWPRTSTEQL